MALNIFDQGDAQERALLVSYLISIFKALWAKLGTAHGGHPP